MVLDEWTFFVPSLKHSNTLTWASFKVFTFFNESLLYVNQVLYMILNREGWYIQLNIQYLSLLTPVLMGLNRNKRLDFNHHITEQELLSVKYLLSVEHLLSNIFAKISKLLTNFLKIITSFCSMIQVTHFKGETDA